MDRSQIHVSQIYIVFTWFVIVLFVAALVIAGSVLIQRKIKPRREYAGPALTAVQLAYVTGGRERAMQTESAASHAGRTPDVHVVMGIDALIAVVHDAGLVDATGKPTAMGDAAVRDMRDQYAYLWPGFHPKWTTLSDDELAMAVALFGPSALTAIASEQPQP
jgi:hypothetical protein